MSRRSVSLLWGARRGGISHRTDRAPQRRTARRGVPPDPTAPKADDLRGHILVVDDIPEMACLIGRHLSEHGYRVAYALSGSEALERMHSERPELVILDDLMPVMDGWHVLAHIRWDTDLMSLPVIMVIEVWPEWLFSPIGYWHGPDMVLQKPVNPEELVAFIQRKLESYRELPEEGGIL